MRPRTACETVPFAQGLAATVCVVGVAAGHIRAGSPCPVQDRRRELSPPHASGSWRGKTCELMNEHSAKRWKIPGGS
jgi:hypothetical protein